MLKAIPYSTVSPEVLQAIADIEVHGQHGAKIQALIKHLIYIEQHEPGSKTIVFSAWDDSLDSKKTFSLVTSTYINSP